MVFLGEKTNASIECLDNQIFDVLGAFRRAIIGANSLKCVLQSAEKFLIVYRHCRFSFRGRVPALGMVTTDFIFNPRCSQGANKRSQNCEMYPKSQVVRHAMGLYTATEDMGRILAINWAKSKCWPEHFRLRTIGIECD
jgi:hypothetical protein